MTTSEKQLRSAFRRLVAAITVEWARWWGHAVCGGFRARINGRTPEIKWINSWGLSYGDQGYFWMAEGKGTPDALFIPRARTVL
jgi:hypothetical protein